MKFLFPHELDRFPYLFRGIVFNLPLTMLAQTQTGVVALLLMLALLTGFLFCAAIPRLNNIGWPLWTVVLIFVPYLGIAYSIFLAFTKSKKDRETEIAALKSSNF
jgi:hypothetical protein